MTLDWNAYYNYIIYPKIGGLVLLWMVLAQLKTEI